MAKIFVCYRREDSEGHAGRIFDRLKSRFGLGNVFMDIDSIPPGADFVEVVNRTLSQCAAVIVIIGPRWLGEGAGGAKPRIHLPGDYVRQEIAQALKSNAKLIPVLVHGATMPKPEQLPRGLGALSRKNAIPILHAAFDSGVEKLIKTLEKLPGMKQAGTRPRPKPAGNAGSTTAGARPRNENKRAAKEGGAGKGTARRGKQAAPTTQRKSEESTKPPRKPRDGRTDSTSRTDRSDAGRAAPRRTQSGGAELGRKGGAPRKNGSKESSAAPSPKRGSAGGNPGKRSTTPKRGRSQPGGKTSSQQPALRKAKTPSNRTQPRGGKPSR